MTEHHFFADTVDANLITLIGDEAHHAARALRVREGEAVTIGDCNGTVAYGVVEGTPTSERVDVRVVQRSTTPRPTPQVQVLPALPKRGKLDVVVQQLTEVGVDRISPWFGERSVARWDAAKARAQGERLRSIARAAGKQSRRAWLPIVDDPGKINGLPDVALVLEPDASRRLSDALRDIETPEIIAIISGPEGGLTDTERDRFASMGALEVSLGPLVLRAETAPVVGSSLVRSAFHLLG